MDDQHDIAAQQEAAKDYQPVLEVSFLPPTSVPAHADSPRAL